MKIQQESVKITLIENVSFVNVPLKTPKLWNDLALLSKVKNRDDFISVVFMQCVPAPDISSWASLNGMMYENTKTATKIMFFHRPDMFFLSTFLSPISYTQNGFHNCNVKEQTYRATLCNPRQYQGGKFTQN